MNTMSAQDFHLLQTNESVAILDIRDKGAYNEGHYENALSIPVTSLPNRLNELSKETTYYIISHAGRRGQTMSQFLVQQGYQAIAVLGGMHALKSNLKVS